MPPVELADLIEIPTQRVTVPHEALDLIGAPGDAKQERDGSDDRSPLADHGTKGTSAHSVQSVASSFGGRVT